MDAVDRSLYEFGDCQVDLARLELRRAGSRVHVEPQVFDVLAHLIVHRDRVVTKGELLDTVWGDRFVSESALTSRIRAARSAVGDDGGAQRVIRTAHGRGYRFVADVIESAPPSAHMSVLPIDDGTDTAGSTDATDGSPRLAAARGADAAAVDRSAPGHDEARLEQHIRFCTTTDGTRLAYATAGSGPPLVKVANWLTHLDYDWDSPVWRHWLVGLARGRELIRYDERGCGLSDWDVDDFSFEAWVDDLEHLVDAVGLDRFPLLGISQGAAVAIAFAVRHPERVSHLVLWGGYGRGRLVRANTPEERREAALDLEVARVGWGREDATFRQVFTSQFLPTGTREQWDALNELQRRTTSPDNAVRFLEVFAEIDVVELATQVRCPTLILHARDDLRVPLASARELAALIPGSRLVPLNSPNHILTAVEPAWPLFLAEVERFLAQDDATG
jgi:pimeloyl-ACP methyl ester carboxylesterase/DNA-binding winged helix-turn-helix (wHTH) protein